MIYLINIFIFTPINNIDFTSLLKNANIYFSFIEYVKNMKEFNKASILYLLKYKQKLTEHWQN